jgi:hypothetical protein
MLFSFGSCSWFFPSASGMVPPAASQTFSSIGFTAFPAFYRGIKAGIAQRILAAAEIF